MLSGRHHAWDVSIVPQVALRHSIHFESNRSSMERAAYIRIKFSEIAAAETRNKFKPRDHVGQSICLFAGARSMSLRQFIAEQKASVAPIFGLAFFTFAAATGAAVDYGRASAARASIQAALDATGLMIAREGDAQSAAEVEQKASSYFQAVFNGHFAKNTQISSEFTSPQPGSYSLKLSATATVDATISRVLGSSTIDIATSANFVWGIKRLELALVLDNTGSMGQSGKLGALKTAAHNLLTTLQNAAKKPEDVKVAIIPFDTSVNIGTGFKDQPWIDYSVKSIQKANWAGCVIDRDQSNDVQDTAPTTSDYRTLFPASTCGTLTSIQPLTNDWTALNNKVDAMTASGNTNVTIGLAWGWHALTADLPLTQAQAPAADLDKVIVLLTDGDNTKNRWTTQGSKIDARTSLACANAKAAGIKIYTVRVIDGDATLLRNCATKPQMFYDVQQADQLNVVFKSIAQSLATLRISQ
jgi:uncharacterized protein YegL